MSKVTKRLALSTVISVLIVVAIIPGFCKHILRMKPSKEEIKELSSLADYVMQSDSGLNIHDFWEMSSILSEEKKTNSGSDSKLAKAYHVEISYGPMEKDEVTGTIHRNINLCFSSSKFFGKFQFKYPIISTEDGNISIEMKMKTGKYINYRWYEYLIYCVLGIPIVYGIMAIINDKKK